ncbi:MAG: GGDEF domain-containing protein [Hydrogenovibrio sp.]
MPDYIRLFNQRFYWGLLGSFFLLLPIAYLLYVWQVDKVRAEEYQFYQSHLMEKVGVLMDEKQNTTQALAVAMTTPPDFKEALLNGDPNLQPKLVHFADQLKTYSKYKGIWIQVIDAKGVSLARSWTEKSGDSLVSVRADVASMLQDPRRINSFSVGKFALTFKSMVPIFDPDDPHRLLGMVDVISQIDSIDQTLAQQDGVHSVVMVDKRYRAQLTEGISGKFIGDYFVANIGASEADMRLIKRFGVDRAFQHQGYLIYDGQLMVSRPIRDLNGVPMATWISFEPLQAFEYINVRRTQNQAIALTVFVVALVVLLLATLYFKRQAEFEKRFFFEVFDASTEIVYVSDRQRILFANRRFFDFFQLFETLEDFHQQYECICDLFVSEEGFLQRYMGEEYWFEYLIAHKDQPHYAKLVWQEREYVFLVKANNIASHYGADYISILMTDITEEELYKARLEYLIAHDELTGVFNRHSFNRALKAVFAAELRPSAFSMVSLDVDHFKLVNDAHGHDMGDKVLIEVANNIEWLLRPQDQLCRVGGEEFAVLLPDTDLATAEQLAEHYRQSIADLTIERGRLSVTISLGVVQLRETDSLQAFYKRADRALYRAKKLGRNRVEVLDV